jgi:hypothetical protein
VLTYYIVFNAAVTFFALVSLQVRDRGGLLQQRKPITELSGHIKLAADALPLLAPAHPVIHRAKEFLDHILEVCNTISKVYLWLQCYPLQPMN